MNAPEPDSPAARERSDTAADWLVKQDRGLSAEEQDAFHDWLAADARHGAWLRVHREVVGDFSKFAQWRPEHSDEPNPDLLAPARRRRVWMIPPALMAAAAAVVVAGAAAIWALGGGNVGTTPMPPASQSESELERRVLADGSTVDLNRGAVVTTDFSVTERRLTLVQGEALFTVTKDPARPFIVQAGGVAIRAVGTAFNVRLDAKAVELLVTEGKVRVDSPAGVNPDRGGAPTIVEAGQRATVAVDHSAPPQVATVSSQISARLLAWQPQLLDFSSAPLESAIAEFNRRNRVQFVIADPEIARVPIVASIRSDKVEGFARFLASVPGVSVERNGSDEIVLRRKP